MIKLEDFSKSKIPIILNWRQDERGDTHVVVTFVDVETYLGTDGEILREEVDYILREYNSLLKSVSRDKLREAAKKKNLKRYWSMCNKLAHFNQKIESRFRVRNMKEAFEHDMGLSMRAVRDAINFATLFKRQEVPDVSFGYVVALMERSTSLKSANLFEEEKKFLKMCSETNELPSREEYRKRLDRIANDGGYR
tara:strand:+ start:143 stop:727 length:585 start_codon:yes stop_codon:yes gene_type:complete